MRFFKGVLVGTMVSAGIMMAYNGGMNRKNLMKRGKQMAKKMGII